MKTATSSPSDKSWFSFSGLLNGAYALLNRAYITISTGISWFSSKKTDYPDNEYGELMRSAIIPQSWFDRLSSQWTEQSLWNKLSVFSGVTLLFGAIGFFSGASLLFSTSAFVFSIGIHSALVSHNTQRVNHAQKIAVRTQSLNSDFEGANQKLDHAFTQVTNLFEQEIKPQGVVLQEITKEIKNEAQLVGISVNEFSTVVQKIEVEQAGYTRVVDDFCVFVNEITKEDEFVEEQLPEHQEHQEERIQQLSIVDISQSAQIKLIQEYIEEEKRVDRELNEIPIRLNTQNEELVLLDERIQVHTRQIRLFDEVLKNIVSKNQIEDMHIIERDVRLKEQHEDLQVFEEVLKTNAIESNKQEEFLRALDIRMIARKEASNIQSEQIKMLLEDKNALNLVEDEQDEPNNSSASFDSWLANIHEQMDIRAQSLNAEFKKPEEVQLIQASNRINDIETGMSERINKRKNIKEERVIGHDYDTQLIKATAQIKDVEAAMNARAARRQVISSTLKARHINQLTAVGFYRQGSNSEDNNDNKENAFVNIRLQ